MLIDAKFAGDKCGDEDVCLSLSSLQTPKVQFWWQSFQREGEQLKYRNNPYLKFSARAIVKLPLPQYSSSR